MKKSVIGTTPSKAGPGDGWLDLEQLASVEVTSEDPDFPIDSVFVSGQGPGWRAADAGRQVLRLVFAERQPIQRIHLEFYETENARMQEFTLRWATSPDGTFKEIVRQQWNFSPHGSTTEVEDYSVNLSGVAVLELTLNPDVSGGAAIASLAQWRLA
jgi:hypothetical protein